MIGKNNPFNLRYSKRNTWIGQEGSTRGFCDFRMLEYCIRAVCITVMRSYRKLGFLSVEEIINRYAPSSENDTKNYVNFVCSYIGSFPFDIMRTVEDYANLLNAMSIMEGCEVPVDLIINVCKQYKIVPLCSRRKK